MTRLLSTLLALALVAVACGSGDSDDTTIPTTEPTTTAPDPTTTTEATTTTAPPESSMWVCQSADFTVVASDTACSHIVPSGSLDFDTDGPNDAAEAEHGEIDGAHASSCSIHPDEVVIENGMVPSAFAGELTPLEPDDASLDAYDEFVDPRAEAFAQIAGLGIGIYKLSNPANLPDILREPGVSPHYFIELAPKWKYGPFNEAMPAGQPSPPSDRPHTAARDVYVIDSGWVNIGNSSIKGATDLDADLLNPQTEPYGHGVFVAGIIHQLSGATVTIVAVRLGVERKADELSVLIALARAGVFAVGAESVVNMSFGTYECDQEDIPLVLAAIENAQPGVDFVAAAGNDKHDPAAGDARYYPASLTRVVAVGAARWDGQGWQAADWSNSPMETPGFSPAYAPGEHVVSVHPGFTPAYAYWSGTSFAAPHVTACVAGGSSCLAALPTNSTTSTQP